MGAMSSTSAGTLEERLRSVGLRVTAPRVAVLRELEHHAHADVDTLVGAVRERHHAVSTQAVYDVLRALTSAGLVRRIEPAGSVARYESRVGDNHHHVVCRSCGAIADARGENRVTSMPRSSISRSWLDSIVSRISSSLMDG